MRFRWPYLVGALLFASGVVTYRHMPDLIRWYVEKHYPYVHPKGSIEVVWGEVLFHDVEVTKPGIEASLDLVKVDAEKHIRVEGGTVDLSLGEAKQELAKGTGEGLSITASGLTTQVRHKELTAQLGDTSVDSSQVCFREGTVQYRNLEAHVWGGCAKRDKTFASADRIEVPIKLPFHLPRIDQDQQVVVIKPEASILDRVIRFESATLGPFHIVGPATIRLPDEGADEDAAFDAPKIVVNHPWVAPHEAWFKDISLTAPIKVFRGGEGKFRLRAGRATVHLDLVNFAIVGEEECSHWLDFLPHPLPEALQQMDGNFEGRMGFEVRLKPMPYLNIKSTCSYKCSAEPIKSLRGHDFTYMPYDKDGELFERKAGPWSPGWVAIADLPPYVPHAFILMEDPGFYVHKGILPEALENSLKANLATGEFVRGGSTISMQLAKNLWLRRHKTVGRKAYEALLTVALESCLGKADILEWYMNVVEYGPDVYGIGAASKHYFHKPAEKLEPDEGYYLASLLPHPKKALPPDGGGLEKARKLMQRLANSGIISEHLVPLKEGEVLDTKDWETTE